MNAIYHKHVAEIWSGDLKDPGPTGRFAHVLAGEVQDHGGNVIFAGTADACFRRLGNIRSMPTRLVPTVWEDAGEDVYGEVLWQLVIEGEGERKS